MQKVLYAVLALCLSAASAFAQTTAGRLVGTVSSPDGVIAGATIVVKNNQTQREQTVSGNEDGAFTFPQLEVGTYTVTITAPGFKTFVANELKIDVGREYSLNPTLEVGGVSETVTVTAGADIINATSATLSNTVSPQQVKELPLVDRNPLDLINLQAGTTGSQGFQVSTVNGMRTTMTNITRDGINVQDAFIRTNATDFSPGRPSVDDTGEFTISTGLADADSGYGGAQIRLVTPRGQSNFHGAAFAFNRNSHFAANSFFNNAAGRYVATDPEVVQGRAQAGAPKSPRAFRNRNQFGGTISGPAWLPRFGEGGPSLWRDRAFFFFNYEGVRDPVSTAAQRNILTPSARAGTFTFNTTCTAATCPAGVTPGQQRSVNILQFAQSVGLAGIPSAIDPVVQARLLAGMPEQGNRSDIGDQLNTTGFQIDRQNTTTRNGYTFRFDVDANESNQFNVVWTWNKEVLLRPDGDNVPITAAYTAVPFVDQSSENRMLALAYRKVFTPNFINEVRGGFFKSDVPFNRLIEIPAFFFTPPSATGAGTTGVPPVVPFVDPAETQFLNQGRKTAGYNFQSNADLIVGSHSFKFGGLFQWFQVDSYNDAATVPTFQLGTGNTAPILTAANFNSLGGISTTQLGTANALLGLLGGIVVAGTQSFNVTSPTSGFVPGATTFSPWRYQNHSLYFQDRWRVRPELSLTLGLRYELYPALRIDNNVGIEPLIPEGTDPRQAILNPQGKYATLGTNAGSPGQYHKTDYNNFAPTIGFAWSPNFKNAFLGALTGGEGRTTIRGGYGFNYVNDSLVTTLNASTIANVGLGRTANPVLNASGQPQLNLRLQDGVPTINPPTFTDPSTRTFIFNNSPSVGSNFGTAFAINPELKTPIVHQYSVGIQRELGFQTALEVRYVGTQSSNLWRGADYNQIDIFSNGFFADFQRARSNFLLTGNAFCATAGCQPLTIFQNGGTPGPGRLVVGTGGLALATFNSNLNNGLPGELAQTGFISGGFNNHPTVADPTRAPFINFLPNPGTGNGFLFENGASYRYDALQVELRRRFSEGLYFQANYTFSKNLTDAIGTSQQLQDTFLDINRPELEKARADWDVTHVMNVNTIYEFPFGRGKTFFSGAGGVLDRIIGGFQLNTIVSLSSGPPLTFVDPRGTFNRLARSARQGITTNLTNDEIRDLVGVYRTPCGVFWIDPKVLNINQEALAAGQCGAGQLGTGRASEGITATPFTGQVFFNNQPGSVGNLGRAVVSGPWYFNVDASLVKNIRITEGSRIQLRMEAFNALNRAHFFPANWILNITSTNFGRLTQTGGNSGGPGGARVMQFAARFEF